MLLSPDKGYEINVTPMESTGNVNVNHHRRQSNEGVVIIKIHSHSWKNGREGTTIGTTLAATTKSNWWAIGSIGNIPSRLGRLIGKTMGIGV